MKTTFNCLLFGIVGTFAIIIFLMSQSFVPAEMEKDTAIVNFQNGFFIFTDSRPAAAYDVVGEEKSFSFTGSQYTDVRDILIRKAKKDFPGADGIICEFVSGKADHATVIKFK